jgi:hypothetical protein
MKAREWLREWLPDIVRIAIALLIVFAFLFQAATWFTGSWKSGLLWAFLLIVAVGIGGAVLGRLSQSLTKEASIEIGIRALALIGLFSICYWVIAPSRPYCDDMDRIRIEVESLDKAVCLFDDGQTDWKEAVRKTEVRMESLRTVVEGCQCPNLD